MSARLAAAALGLVLATASTPLLAEGSDKSGVDGVYGRFDGDLDLSLGVGAAIVRGGPTAALVGRALFFNMVGPYVAYTEGFGSQNPLPPRSLALGIGFRPFFLPRWGYDLQHGPAILDLTIDATTFDFGVLWSADERGDMNHPPGFELALGTEVPLAGQAAGPWIGVRGALLWRGSELAATSGVGEPPLRAAAFLTFAWHFLANTHLVGANDQRAR